MEPHLALRAARASPPPSPALRVTGTVALPQVEDITTSHEAALQETETSHTEAIAALQSDHAHKVQGSYQPGLGASGRPQWAMRAGPSCADRGAPSPRGPLPIQVCPPSASCGQERWQAGVRGNCSQPRPLREPLPARVPAQGSRGAGQGRQEVLDLPRRSRGRPRVRTALLRQAWASWPGPRFVVR